jgi:hypothetical protein
MRIKAHGCSHERAHPLLQAAHTHVHNSTAVLHFAIATSTTASTTSELKKRIKAVEKPLR